MAEPHQANLGKLLVVESWSWAPTFPMHKTQFFYYFIDRKRHWKRWRVDFVSLPDLHVFKFTDEETLPKGTRTSGSHCASSIKVAKLTFFSVLCGYRDARISLLGLSNVVNSFTASGRPGVYVNVDGEFLHRFWNWLQSAIAYAVSIAGTGTLPEPTCKPW